MRGMRPLLAAATLAAAAGCTTLPVPLPAPCGQAPVLALSPSSLGRSLALHQLLLVQGADASTHRLEALLEADAASVRLAVLGPGAQPVARLAWDGQRLERTQLPGWPASLPAQRVLSDLQLVLWPAGEIARSLPAPWTLDTHDGERHLRCGDELVAVVRYTGASQAELSHRRDGYRIRIESKPLAEVPS